MATSKYQGMETKIRCDHEGGGFLQEFIHMKVIVGSGIGVVANRTRMRVELFDDNLKGKIVSVKVNELRLCTAICRDKILHRIV